MELEVVARDEPIREANQDRAPARRARIRTRRSESIEPSTRGLSVARRDRPSSNRPGRRTSEASRATSASSLNATSEARLQEQEARQHGRAPRSNGNSGRSVRYGSPVQAETREAETEQRERAPSGVGRRHGSTECTSTLNPASRRYSPEQAGCNAGRWPSGLPPPQTSFARTGNARAAPTARPPAPSSARAPQCPRASA